MKRALCGAALIGALMTMTSCAATQQFLASTGGGMFLKLGPASLGFAGSQQGWMALNSLNWSGNQPYGTYSPYDTTGQAYGYGTTQQYGYGTAQQPYGYDTSQQTYGYDTSQQTYGTQQQQYGYDTSQQTYGTTNPTAETQTYGATAAPTAVPTGAGLASLTTNDPQAAQALAQACASGQTTGPVTVRQVQPDGTYQDIQLQGVTISCGGPAAGGQPGEAFGPGDEVLMTFSDAKVVNTGKVKLRRSR